MSVTRRDLLKMAGAAGVMGMAPAIVRAQKLEKTKVQIAVGGKPLIYYLPLSIAEARGYFKDEGWTSASPTSRVAPRPCRPWWAAAPTSSPARSSTRCPCSPRARPIAPSCCRAARR